MKTAVLLLSLLFLTLLTGVAFAFLTTSARIEPPSDWFEVIDVSSLPADGESVRVAIQVPERDAWARLPDRVLGSIFVRRLPDNQGIIALRAEHHGSFRIPVKYDKANRLFRSGCWLVAFDLDGNEIAEEGRRLIGDELTQLPVVIIDGKVWVRFQQVE